VADELDESVDVSELHGWNPAAPSPRFAERVVDVWQRERQAVHGARSRWRSVGVMATVATLAAALLLWWSWPRGHSDHGTLLAEARKTMLLGSRARVVVEPGTQMKWQVDSTGAARVEQDVGSAFYRVEGGAPFEVITPYGTVSVTGTCFTVEIVDDMEHKKTMWGKGMVVGAALAAAVVVTVYEGGVVLADSSGTVELGPGERGVADGAGRPSRLGATARDQDERGKLDSSQLADHVRTQARELERMRARDAEQRARITALSEEVEALGGSVADESPSVVAQRCVRAMRGEEGCSFVDPDQETLLEMARCGTVKVDQPSFLEADFGSAVFPPAHEVGLSPDEAEILAQTAEQFREQYTKNLRDLYVEAGGNPALVEDLPPRAIDGMLRTMLDRSDLEAAHRLVSNERAGLADPSQSPNASLAERYARHMLDVGNRFEQAVAETLGPDRAHDLRRAEDGWPGGTSVYSGSCEE
jgi:hypothetical protein